MSKPSQLPWKLRKHAALGCFIEGPKAPDMPYALEVMGDDYNGYGDGEQREADAAFIVKACNSHDELVSALRGLMNAEEPDGAHLLGETESQRAAYAKACHVLAKLEAA